MKKNEMKYKLRTFAMWMSEQPFFHTELWKKKSFYTVKLYFQTLAKLK